MSYNRWQRPEAKMAHDLQEAGFTNKYIADELNATFGTDRTINKVKDARRKGVFARLLEVPDSAEDRAPQLTEENSDGSTSIKANRPYAKEELAQIFGIDPDEWTCDKFISNTWANSWQSKAWWSPNERNIVANNWEAMLEEVRQRPVPEYAEPRHAGNLLYEMCLFDAHLGAKAWGPETGEDYDLYIGVARYAKAFYDLLDRRPEGTERILFVVGQDLFHFDTLINGKGGATAKGTPQDVDTRWQKLFVATCQMLTDLISTAAEVAVVDILVVPGNHDTQTTFYCGEYIDAFFNNDHRVRIDNTPKTRKYYTFGDVTLGFTHGDNEKAKDLYGLMTEEVSLVSTHREWHRGHLHQEQCSEDGRMRIRTMPALSGTESWHSQKGYRSLPGARALVWHRDRGLDQQVYHNVPVAEYQTDNMGAILGA